MTSRYVLIGLIIQFVSFNLLFGHDAHAQLDKVIHTNLNGKTVEEIFSVIESETAFNFIYDSRRVDVSRKIPGWQPDLTVEAIIKKMALEGHMAFKPIDNTITVIHSARRTINSSPLRRTARITETWNTNLSLAFPDIKSHLEFQQGTVNGTVTDKETGAALPGVSVQVKGTTIGTSADENGKYEVDVPAGAVLVFSMMGYRSLEVPVGNRSVVNVQLEMDLARLEEVVVVGYGTQQQRNISGSVTNLSERDFNKGVNRNAVDMLQGKVAGLIVTTGSGDVSSEKTIRLRGTSSLTGSSAPFVVIDGVPGLNMNSVAPQDIESISILKDASAAAIYGSRAASGVILITTKKGTKGAGKPVVEYEGFVATDKVTNMPEVLDAATWRSYTTENDINTEGMDLGASTNWFEEIMRTAVTQSHSLSMSGGNQASSYRGSLTYLDKQGVVRDNALERFNARLSFNQRALDDRLNLTFTGAMTERNYSPTDTRNFVLAYNMIPVVPVKMEDGSWYDSQSYDQGNPVRNMTYNSFNHKNSLYYGNLKANLTLAEGLTAGINLLKQRESNDYDEYLNSQTERGRNDQGFAKRESWTADKQLIETTLNYELTTGEHDLNFLAGYSYEDNNYQRSGAQNRQFVTDFFGSDNLGAGENLRPADVWSEANMFKLASFFGRVNYTFNSKYILTASLRRDGSSKFGENHKWGTFPSVSAAWLVSDEDFMQSAAFFDYLKIRTGYGVSGNQAGIDPYKTLQLYGQSGRYYDNGSWYTAYQISQNANPNLKWEETAMFNIGVDYSLFNGRLNGTIEYYDKRTSDLLYTYQVPVPPNLYPDMLANVGSMSNKGVEFLFNTDAIRKNDFRWNISLNIAHNENEITELSNEDFSTSSIKTGSAWIRGGSDNTTHIVEEGREVGTFYGWRALGLDENGKYIMDDMVDGKAGLTDEDRTYIGSAQPELTYGIANSFTYKNWEFNFFLRGVSGNDVLNFSRMSYATTQWLPGANVLEDALVNGLTDNPKYSSFYIEDGSFLRLDNASLAYNFDTQNFLGISRFRVFVTGQNLFIITNYTGLDPEITMDGLDPGVEGREYYPKSRTLSFGVNLSF
ncbi:iron complex outermembrane receptor protein [Anseongella ginsenosidimutans]|uniref:Iron complex outermembrane receptor protein n=2 Tax=Anseongella ginsenosidimutans TaxID=496056 RepID=A0A4R3KNG4_9SPHI|nr:iron complex outermembrane receptor protein [Anseongella ginsenosidimutans]